MRISASRSTALPMLLASWFAATGVSAQTAAAPTREHYAPPGWERSYHDLHYSPVVRIGDRVIVSGIPAMEGADDEAKARWVFRELQAHLRSAGAELEDVIELQSFHVARDQAEFRDRIKPVLKVHREFFKNHYPAWTAVATTGLFTKETSFELRAEAVIGSGRRPKAEIAAPKQP
ncbi:Rid family hydrolase [Lysobacter sp. CA199]|uniref:Rid family hydrolase n=1 Tax=Lysobacter sp. CA199 TaxID=3455608 RepID=UPI003F8D8A70